jgi:hypothetical protein
MEVRCQLHAPAALLPGKEHPVPIGPEAGWAPDPVSTRWRREMPSEHSAVRFCVDPPPDFMVKSDR